VFDAGIIARTEQPGRQPQAPVPERDGGLPLLALVEAPAVTVLRAPADVEPIRDVWHELGGDAVDADPDHFLWSLGGEPQVVRPHVLVVGRRSRPAAIVAGRIVEVRLPCRVGTRTLFAPRVRALCVVRGGLRGRLSADEAAAVVDELLAALDRREADVVLFRQLTEGTALQRALSARATLLERRQHAARTTRRWLIDLPASHDDYLATLSGSTRKGVRRTERKLAQELGDRLAVARYGGAGDVERCLDEIEAIAARTYQRQLGVGFLGDARQRARLTMLAGRGWLRAYVLSLDARPIAFELGELYNGRFHSLAGGYDPAYAHLGVGGHLLQHAIGDLAADPEVELFDFGFGDAPYKAKLAHRALTEGDLILYAPRLRPRAVSVVRTTLLELSQLLTRSLDRMALLERIRRRMRRPPLYGTASACSTGSPRTT
jgi:hypothetical protein